MNEYVRDFFLAGLEKKSSRTQNDSLEANPSNISDKMYAHTRKCVTCTLEVLKTREFVEKFYLCYHCEQCDHILYHFGLCGYHILIIGVIGSEKVKTFVLVQSYCINLKIFSIIHK